MKAIHQHILGLSVLLFTVNTMAQEMDTIHLERTIENPNPTLAGLDTWFSEGVQLIAYGSSSNSDTGDTLVVYDYLNDTVIYKLEGSGWKYNINFVNQNRLLFLNTGSRIIYSLNDFSDPVLHKILHQDFNHYVYDYALSENNENVAVRIWNYDTDETHIYWYNYSELDDTLSVLDSFKIGNVPYESQIAISDQNEFIAVTLGYERDSIFLINTGTGVVDKIPTSVNGGSYAATFFRKDDNLMLAVTGGYTNGGVDIIDVADKSVVQSVPVFANYNYSAFVDTAQRYMLCAGYNAEVRLMDMENESFTTVANYFTPSIATIAKFTDDNKYIVAGTGYDQALVLVFKIIYENEVIDVLNEVNDEIAIYPVPVNDILQIRGILPNTYAEIYSLNGNLIFSSLITGGAIDFTVLPAGSYILKLKNNEMAPMVKYIIKQ